MLILLIPLTLINYIRNLKLLAPFSSLANVITFVGLGMIMVYVFDDLPPLTEREMFGSFRNFSLYFGITLFALEAVGVVRHRKIVTELIFFAFISIFIIFL